MPEDKKTKTIEGVEVFAEGTWNGDAYTTKDLQDMVDAFNATKDKLKPYLKLGHSEDQTLLQRDGLPSAGWISNLYIKGKKLLADFTDIPEKIYKLLENRAYRKVSSEIWWNCKIGENKYNKYLSAVALLGSDVPAVDSLDDILALYGIKLDPECIKNYDKIKNDAIIKLYNFKDTLKEDSMSEDLKKKLEDKENELKKFKADQEKTNNELNELKKYKQEAEVREQKLLEEKIKIENDKFIGELENKKLCSKSMRPYIEQLIGAEKKEYSIVKEDKSEQKLTKYALVEEILKLYSEAAKVNFEENSEEGKKDDVKKDDLETKIAEYAKANNIDLDKDYVKAYTAVLNEMNEEVEEDSEDESDENEE